MKYLAWTIYGIAGFLVLAFFLASLHQQSIPDRINQSCERNYVGHDAVNECKTDLMIKYFYKLEADKDRKVKADAGL